MTEYFVEKLDYEDEKGITLAYELHKATLEENYDLDAIMQEYRTECEEAEEEEEPDTEEAWEEEEISDSLFTLDTEEEYIRDIKRTLFPYGCSGLCYYRETESVAGKTI